MAIFKCKICGGTLNIIDGVTICECEYCGTKQTLPKLDNEKRISLYERANYFRRNNEFDKAMGIYEVILSEDNDDAEAYWSIVLCRYGIEYVEDPNTHKMVPTVNRANSKSILKDLDYLKAIQYADEYQKSIFEEEAKNIDNIQKNILSISSKEDPYDIFICYKETDSLGQRTHDSVFAQDIYNALTKEGFRVFFSRVTLEDKIGTAYEPYIYAALNSAKVMLVVGSSAENMNSPWVKNEWSRFLSLIKQDSKKVIIPCYKDMSPYDMPEEFAYLQAQDIGKIGFMQDLLYGVKKVITNNSSGTIKETVIEKTQNSKAKPLLERAYIFLSDYEWNKANQYAERVLDIEPKNAKAYMCKFLASNKISSFDELKYKTINQHFVCELNSDYFKAIEFAESDYANELEEFIQKRNEAQYINACDMMNNHNYTSAKNVFDKLDTYKDSQVKSEESRQNISMLKSKLNEINQGQKNINTLTNQFEQYENAKQKASEQIEECNNRINYAPQIIKQSKKLIIVSLILWFIFALIIICLASKSEIGEDLEIILALPFLIMYIVFNIMWTIYLKRYSNLDKTKIKIMIICGVFFTPLANAIALLNAGGIIDENNEIISKIEKIRTDLHQIINDAELAQKDIELNIAQNRSFINAANEIVTQLSEKGNIIKQTAVEEKDPLFIEAGNIIMEAGTASISLIQRKLSISYSRGVTIIEQLENAGVISEYDGVNPRKVTMSKEKWNSLKYEL